MKPFALFISLCLLASCGKKEQITPPVGLKSTNLPTALSSRKIEDKESRYIEIVISDDRTEFFHQGKWVTTTTTSEELCSVIKKFREENETLGYATPLLISAPSSTHFSAIVERIRTAAESGITKILFLVRSEQTSEPRIVFTELPSIAPGLPKIEPYFLQITSEGHIYSGTGESRTQIDSRTQGQQLNELSDLLKLFSSASKSAGIQNPPCQIYVEPKATYQRVIDVISLTNKFQLQLIFTDMILEPEPEPIPGSSIKPTPPSSGITPLGLAPKE
ncbi:MAG: hypothetical protein V4727_05305 [Verrucomicrobiota bacterium]